VEQFGEIMPVTGKEMLQEILHPTRKAMEKHGITVDYLILKGKKLLEAEKTVFQKVKGDLDSRYNKRSKIVAKAKGSLLNPGETVVAIFTDDLAIQQKQEDMFYKLGGHYPNEKVDHNVNIGPELSEDEAKMAKEAVEYVLKRALSGKRDDE